MEDLRHCIVFLKLSSFGFLHHRAALIGRNEAPCPTLRPGFKVTSLEPPSSECPSVQFLSLSFFTFFASSILHLQGFLHSYSGCFTGETMPLPVDARPLFSWETSNWKNSLYRTNLYVNHFLKPSWGAISVYLMISRRKSCLLPVFKEQLFIRLFKVVLLMFICCTG